MKWLSKKQWIRITVWAVIGVVVLAWPVADWLECREKHTAGPQVPDAIYLVAGSIDQDRRIDALLNFASQFIDSSAPTNAGLIVLVGNDRLRSRWSSEDQSNLTRAEWGVKNIRSGFDSSAVPVEIVPGRFGGTDGEMEALGCYLANHDKIQNLVLVTSPFHVRRTLKRFAIYQPRDMGVSVRVARPKWTDRAPWTVLGELFKMGRDSLGLSRAPLLSRRVL